MSNCLRWDELVRLSGIRKLRPLAIFDFFFFFLSCQQDQQAKRSRSTFGGVLSAPRNLQKLCGGRLPGILSRLPFQWVIITAELEGRQTLRAPVHSARPCGIMNVFAMAVS